MLKTVILYTITLWDHGSIFETSKAVLQVYIMI